MNMALYSMYASSLLYVDLAIEARTDCSRTVTYHMHVTVDTSSGELIPQSPRHRGSFSTVQVFPMPPGMDFVARSLPIIEGALLPNCLRVRTES